MQYIILSSILAFIITFFAIPVIIQIAKTKKLFDEPDERKVHKEVIPTLGGVGIFAGFIIAILMCVPNDLALAADVNKLKYFAASAIVIFFLGLKDDIMDLSATKKFIGQIIAAGIIVRFGSIYLNNMHGFLGITTIPYYASVFLTIFTIIVITNSFNLIDGVDGLAGSLGLVTSLVFGIYFYFAKEYTYSVMAFSLTGATAGFLIYNYSPAKIFMGDTGSLLLGLINAVLVIKFINVAGSEGNNFSLHASPALGYAILSVPLFDTLRVFSLRILDRRSPFSADRMHVHHYLLDLGFSHKQIVASSILSTLVFIGVAFILRDFNTTVIVGILLVMSSTIIGIIYYFKQKAKLPAGTKFEAAQKIRTRHTIYKFSHEPVTQD